MLGIDLGSHGGFLWMNFITTESYDVTAERMVRIWGGVTIPEMATIQVRDLLVIYIYNQLYVRM